MLPVQLELQVQLVTWDQRDQQVRQLAEGDEPDHGVAHLLEDTQP